MPKRIPGAREADAWLSDEQLEKCAPAESDDFQSPVPTRMISNGRLADFLASRASRVAFAGATALIASLVIARQAAADSDARLAIESVSNRADLVSGGDVLVRVTLPRGTAREHRARLFVNGAPFQGELHAAPDGHGYLALVTGLNLGPNTLTLTAEGRGVQLEVTNHSIGGPVFSGPHLEPWGCTTAAAGLGPPTDADCNAPTQYAFYYKSASSGQIVSYDLANPPARSQIATTTTDQGRTVSFIVREETGTLNRSIYRIAVLFDPEGSWAPWAPQPGWNGKLAYLFGAGAQTQWSQSTFATTLLVDNLSPTFIFNTPLNAEALSRGFATAAATLTDEQSVTNAKLNAETLMMVKEHFIEAYGVIRYTIGEGCSGGSIQQHSIGDQYPGLIDGLLPLCSYPDMWSLVVNGHDCMGLTHYFNSSTLFASALDRLAVLGEASEQECPGQDGPPAFGSRWFPATNKSCLIPTPQLYDPVTNPHGARCGMKDFHVNEIGVRPQDGFAYQVFDSIGLQYGLKALEAGSITPEQFVDLNENVGGMNIDGNWQPQRTSGDRIGIANMYRSGLITYGRELGKYPIIDARRDDNFEMHNNSEWIFTRNRILRSNGRAPNQVHWWENVPAGAGIPPISTSLKAFNLMDQWLAAIEADKSALPHEEKVERNKPAEAHDACIIDGQEYSWTPGSICDKQFTYTGLIRMTAGGPATNDVLKCQLKPLKQADYSVTFTPAQWARLQRTFPDGVCDFSKHGVGQRPPLAPWLTFESGPGGVPLGPPPTATSDDEDEDHQEDR